MSQHSLQPQLCHPERSEEVESLPRAMSRGTLCFNRGKLVFQQVKKYGNNQMLESLA